MQTLDKLIIGLARGAKWLSGIVAGVALALLCSDVVIRYFYPQHLSDWTTEVVTYLVVWGLFLVAGELVIDGKHVHADLFIDRLNPQAFSLLLLVLGTDVVKFSMMIGEESDSTLRIPKSIYYAALPVGMALQCLGYIVRVRAEMIGQRTANPVPSGYSFNRD
jgi:C4-dicarboxylate transporter, DctQ subunit